METVQYSQVTLLRLRNVLTYARSKLSANQRRYKSDFARRVSFRPGINAGDSVYVDRPPRVLTKAEMEDLGRLDGNTTVASHKLLPKWEEPYRLRFATHTVIHIV